MATPKSAQLKPNTVVDKMNPKARDPAGSPSRPLPTSTASRREEGVGPEGAHEQPRTDEGREEASEAQSAHGLRLAGVEADYRHQKQQCADQPQRILDRLGGGQGLFAKVLGVSAEQLQHHAP